MFVIYPKCYAKNFLEYVGFIVEFEEDVSQYLSMWLSELVCNGRRARENNLFNFSPNVSIRDGKLITKYIASNIKVDVDNIYIITIKYKKTKVCCISERTKMTVENIFEFRFSDGYAGGIVIANDLSSAKIKCEKYIAVHFNDLENEDKIVTVYPIKNLSDDEVHVIFIE